AMNAAYLAVQILAIGDEDLAKALKEERRAKEEKLIKDSKSVEVIL
ncbi:5-(carboxyamino)imidazole ribonucleotide mutase, partial [Campylobacter helveticus]